MRALALAGMLLSASLSSWLSGSTSALAAKAVPPAPAYYVLDEPKLLQPATTRALQTLFSEQERLTTEQVVFAIFNSLDDEDLVEYTNRVFADWKIGIRGKDNGVLLALFAKEHKIRIEVGYGLEPLMTDARARQIIEDSLVPELSAGNPDQAMVNAALDILRTLTSPMIESNQAAQILQAAQSAGGRVSPIPPVRSGRGWGVFPLFGLILAWFIVSRLMRAEAHFTGNGWYRPRPRIRGSWGGWGGFGGGGGFGGLGGGGGGGFSGGGGRSGGGGASGSW